MLDIVNIDIILIIDFSYTMQLHCTCKPTDYVRSYPLPVPY